MRCLKSRGGSFVTDSALRGINGLRSLPGGEGDFCHGLLSGTIVVRRRIIFFCLLILCCFSCASASAQNLVASPSSLSINAQPGFYTYKRVTVSSTGAA